MSESKYLDIPRIDMILQAEEVRRKTPNADVYFKFTCEKCGERCTLEEPNTLYDGGICAACGHEQPITKGGFAVKFNSVEDAMKHIETLKK